MRKLKWKRVSYKRFTAKIGRLSISIKRIGRAPHYKWIPDEIFGAHFLTRLEFTVPAAAMFYAQRLATQTLEKARLALMHFNEIPGLNLAIAKHMANHAIAGLDENLRKRKGRRR